jgi:molecular chaperone HscA
MTIIGIDLGTTNSLVVENGKVLANIKSISRGVKSVKRLIGRKIEDIIHLQPFYADNIETIPAIEISAEILLELKTIAESKLKTIITDCVITVPAYFDEAQRSSTKQAAKIAGLKCRRLLAEPTAAALSFGLDNASNGLYAVYDLGGGTFDISILKLEKEVFQVIATGGDSLLGGDDFDKLIAEHYGISIDAAQTKKESGNFDLAIVKTLVDKTITIFRKTLLQADIETSDLDGVVMVGGSTKMTAIVDSVSKFIGKPPITSVNPDEIVAMGAGIVAGNLSNGGGSLLLDVVPLSLGIETYGGLMEVIIERNTPLPAYKTSRFTTFVDNQTGLDIHILQGEREVAKNCRSLSRFELKGIPPMKAGLADVEISFNLDVDGILSVSAIEKTTNLSQEIEVKPSYGLSDAAIDEIINNSMENARADISTRLLLESKIVAEALIKNVEEYINDNPSESIEERLSLLKASMLTTDRDDIDYQIEQLDRVAAPLFQDKLNQHLQSLVGGRNITEF